MLGSRGSANGSGASSRFFDAAGPIDHADTAAGRVELPIRYYRSDCFLGVFSADADAVAARLPSDELAPVRLSGHRTALGVVAYNYIETGVGAYGEIGVAAMCTFGGPTVPVLPALLETRWPRFGAFVLHLPVTTRLARAAGREVWGYPKFVADMAFDLQPERQRVELREGGTDLLRLEVGRRGRIVRDNRPLVTYTAKDGDLIRTQVASRAVYQMCVGRPNGHLELGDHPLADELRALDLSPTARATRTFLSHAAILPRGRVVARADRPYEGFAGSDLECGRHTVRYDRAVERVITEHAPVLAGGA